ncbi:MAG: (Fe-S)-binding protein [Sphingobacteriales bacterium]|nr:MAG: (Fe-S)-binding protein [Sphingobacteriales bacterium]
MRIQLFVPCFVDQLFPQTAFNMVKVLERAGCDVTYNPAQTCCGQPAFNAGYWEEAGTVARKFCTDFADAAPIVAPSGSCTGFVRNYFSKILPEELTTGPEAVPQRAFEFTEFLTGTLGIRKIEGFFEGRAVYHDACGALRECGIKQGPRELLSGIRGLELVEMKEAETCCGFGGTFAVKYESISVGMAQTKVQSAIEAGADYIISTDLSCLMHIQGYIEKQGLPLQTLHIADVLAAGL